MFKKYIHNILDTYNHITDIVDYSISKNFVFSNESKKTLEKIVIPYDKIKSIPKVIRMLDSKTFELLRKARLKAIDEQYKRNLESSIAYFRSK